MKCLPLLGSFTREEIGELITLHSIRHASFGPARGAVESEILFGLRVASWYFWIKRVEVMKCLFLLCSFIGWEIRELISLHSICHANAGPAGGSVESEILFKLIEGGLVLSEEGC